MDKFKGKYNIKSNRLIDWDYSSNAMYFITIVTQNRECNLGSIENEEMVLSDFGKIIETEWLKSFKIRKELFLDEYIIMPNHIHAIIIINNNDVETHGRASNNQSNERASNNQPTGRASNNQPNERASNNQPNERASNNQPNESESKIDSNECVFNIAINAPLYKIDPHESYNIDTHDREFKIDPHGFNNIDTHGFHNIDTHGFNNIDTHGFNNIDTHVRASLRGDAKFSLHRLPKSISSFVSGYKSAINTKIDDYIDNHQLQIPKYNRNNHFFQPNYFDHIIRNNESYEKIKNYIINNPQNWNNDKFNIPK
jgi:REP element-mobilizing transposase RayT